MTMKTLTQIAKNAALDICFARRAGYIEARHSDNKLITRGKTAGEVSNRLSQRIPEWCGACNQVRS